MPILEIKELPWQHPLRRLFVYKPSLETETAFLEAIGLDIKQKSQYYYRPDSIRLCLMNTAIAGLQEYLGRKLSDKEKVWLLLGEGPPPKTLQICENFNQGAASDG